MYDLAIIGNGIIGSLAAEKISMNSTKNFKIALIGPKNYLNSGSMASGAMINVFSEMDSFANGKKYYEKKIQIGKISTEIWNNILKKKMFNNVKTANNTIVYRELDAPIYEKKIYDFILKKSTENCKILKKNYRFFDENKKEYFSLKNEIAIDSNKFINLLTESLKKNKKINFIDNFANCVEINNTKNYQKIYLNKNKLYAKKILVCCGPNSNKIIKTIKNDAIDIFTSIGDAFRVSNAEIFLNQIPKKNVIRSVNRGSACGIHVVPLDKKSFYLGASSIPTKNPDIEKIKFGSIEFLLSTFRKEIFKWTNSFRIEHLRGYRAISIDGQPCVGQLNKNIFVISGLFRDGLTNAPYYVDKFHKWLELDKNWDQNIEDWSPTRQAISYASKKNSIDEYVNTKLCGLISHECLYGKSKNQLTDELYQEAKKIYRKLLKQKKIEKNFGVNPILLNIL